MGKRVLSAPQNALKKANGLSNNLKKWKNGGFFELIFEKIYVGLMRSLEID